LKAIDTNLLVRVVTRDSPKTADAIVAYLEGGDSFFVPITVTFELESVLRCVYQWKRPQVANALNTLLSTATLVFENESEIEAALDTMTTTRAGFPDALHLLLAQLLGHTPFVTIDKAASRLPGAERLTV
jgi:predicted nucleic-acid-binding protein